MKMIQALRIGLDPAKWLDIHIMITHYSLLMMHISLKFFNL